MTHRSRMPENDQQRPEVGRRQLVGGAVWSVPVISLAAAAPAAAASRCAPVTFVWLGGGRTKNSVFVSGAAGGVTVSVTVSGSNAGPSNNRINAESTTTFNGYTSYYEQELLSPATSSTTNPLTTTLNFSQPVLGLSFSFFDIDRGSAGTAPSYIDAVTITSHTAGIDYSATNGVNVQGDGSPTTPWQGKSGTGQISAKEGNADVVFTVPVSSFTWTYRDLSDGTSTDHFIGLSDLTFTPTSC